MGPTQYIAIYAAIIATSTFLWNIIIWRLNKRRLKLKCRFVFIRGTEESPHPGEFIEYKIINLSDKSLRVSGISGTVKTPDGKGYFSLADNKLPQAINPMDSFLLYKPAPHVFDERLSSVFVEDSIGRKYKMSRSLIKKMKKKGKTYNKGYQDAESLISYNPPLRDIE